MSVCILSLHNKISILSYCCALAHFVQHISLAFGPPFLLFICQCAGCLRALLLPASKYSVAAHNVFLCRCPLTHHSFLNVVHILPPWLTIIKVFQFCHHRGIWSQTHRLIPLTELAPQCAVGPDICLSLSCTDAGPAMEPNDHCEQIPTCKLLYPNLPG